MPINPQFPIFTFSFSLSHDPISNLHCHDTLEWGICLKGNGIFIIDNCIQTYEAGDMIAISPGVYHRAKSGAGMDDLWDFVYFDPAEWSAPEQPEGIRKVIKFSSDPDLNPLLALLVDEIRKQGDGCRTSIMGLISTITVRLSRLQKKHLHEYSPKQFPQVIEVDSRICKAMDILISSESHQHRIHDLAECCCLSVSRFRQMFKEQVGMSPKHFQTKLKVNMAMNKLKDRKKKILDISYECGFESLSSFNRQFKKETGISPQQWRELQKR